MSGDTFTLERGKSFIRNRSNLSNEGRGEKNNDRSICVLSYYLYKLTDFNKRPVIVVVIINKELITLLKQ